MSARNWTTYHQECSRFGLEAPPPNVTTSANLAFQNMYYQAKAINTCCAGKTGTYGLADDGKSVDCMIYCPIADTDAERKKLTDCINATEEAKDDPNGGFAYSSSPERNSDGTVKNGASTLIDATKGGMLGYVVLFLGVSSAVFGVL